MASLETQFQNVIKKVRQEAKVKMEAKMERAANKIASNIAKYKDYNDVTGNLYKSTAVGVFNDGTLMSIHHAPGPSPTRPTLAAGERYNLDKYYSGHPVHLLGRPFKGKVGVGGERGEYKGEEKLFDSDGEHGRGDLTWQLKIVAGVDYADYVQTVRGHDVITSLREYAARYFKTM